MISNAVSCKRTRACIPPYSTLYRFRYVGFTARNDNSDLPGATGFTGLIYAIMVVWISILVRIIIVNKITRRSRIISTSCTRQLRAAVYSIFMLACSHTPLHLLRAIKSYNLMGTYRLT